MPQKKSLPERDPFLNSDASREGKWEAGIGLDDSNIFQLMYMVTSFAGFIRILIQRKGDTAGHPCQLEDKVTAGTGGACQATQERALGHVGPIPGG